MALSLEYPTSIFNKILKQLSKNELAQFRNSLSSPRNPQVLNIIEVCNSLFFENIVIYNHLDFEYLTQNINDDDDIIEAEYLSGTNRCKLNFFAKRKQELDKSIYSDKAQMIDTDQILGPDEDDESAFIDNEIFHNYNNVPLNEEVYLTFEQVSMIDFGKTRSLKFICCAQHRIFPKCKDSKLINYSIPNNCLAKQSPGTNWLGLFIKMFPNLQRLENTCMELQLEFDNLAIKEYHCADKGVSLYQTNVENIENLYLNNLYYLKYFNLKNYNFLNLKELVINECFFFDINGINMKSTTLKVLKVLNMNDSDNSNNNSHSGNTSLNGYHNNISSSSINCITSNSIGGNNNPNNEKNIITSYSFKEFNNKNLPELVQLDIRNCNIKIIPNIFFKKLTKLNLSNNTISVLNNIKCENLSHLDLSYNIINMIGYGLHDLKNLKSLNLSHNNITDINCLKILNNLEDLNLSFNNIQEIKNLDYLKKLKILKLSNNKIDNMGDNFRFKHLKELYLNNNKVKVIKNLSFAKNLEILDLSFNKIYKIEQDFNQLKSLRILTLKNNYIKSFNNINNMVSLLELNLNHNEISELDYKLNFPNLINFAMSHNNVFSLKNLQNIENLQYFNLSNNSILKISNIPKNNLRFLNLSNNKICSIQELNLIFQNKISMISLLYTNNSYSHLSRKFPKNCEKLLKSVISDLKAIDSQQKLMRIRLSLDFPILASILTYECQNKIVY